MTADMRFGFAFSAEAETWYDAPGATTRAEAAAYALASDLWINDGGDMVFTCRAEAVDLVPYLLETDLECLLDCAEDDLAEDAPWQAMPVFARDQVALDNLARLRETAIRAWLTLHPPRPVWKAVDIEPWVPAPAAIEAEAA